jgi:hypothetical protein
MSQRRHGCLADLFVGDVESDELVQVRRRGDLGALGSLDGFRLKVEPFGEPVQAHRKSATDELTPNAGRGCLPAIGVFAYFSWDFALLLASLELSGLGEIIRGAVVTLGVSTAPRTSRGKTLALSPRDSKRVNANVPTAPRVRLRTRPTSLFAGERFAVEPIEVNTARKHASGD